MILLFICLDRYIYSCGILTYTFFHLIPATINTPIPPSTPMQVDNITLKLMAIFSDLEYGLHVPQSGVHMLSPSSQ